MPPEPDAPIIVEIDPEIEDLVQGFLGNCADYVEQMCAALDEGDYATVQDLGHGLKGAGGGYGFDAITDIGARIEQAAKDRDAEEMRSQISSLRVYLDRVEVVCE